MFAKRILTTVLLTSVAACAVDDPIDQTVDEGDGKADGPTRASSSACMARNPNNKELRLTNVVGCEMWEMINKRNWGTMHLDFHTLRRYWTMPADAQAEIRDQVSARGESDPVRYLRTVKQEGDPGSGLEFCAMHGAMIQALRDNFAPDSDRCYTGSGATAKPVYQPITRARTEDPACDYRYTLDGWSSDAQILQAISGAYGTGSPQYQRMQQAITKLSDVESFRAVANTTANDSQAWGAEDAWCLALQTTLRLAPLAPNTPPGATPKYVQFSAPWGGIHNSLHGMFSAGTPLAKQPGEVAIDVGDPGANLKNRLFWALHGWVEFKYRQTRAALSRNVTTSSPVQQRLTYGTAGQCGDGPGRLWAKSWDSKLFAPGADRTAVWKEMELACGRDYIAEASSWRNHLDIYGNDSLFADAPDISKRLQDARFFTGVPAGTANPGPSGFPLVPSVTTHPSIP